MICSLKKERSSWKCLLDSQFCWNKKWVAGGLELSSVSRVSLPPMPLKGLMLRWPLLFKRKFYTRNPSSKIVNNPRLQVKKQSLQDLKIVTKLITISFIYAVFQLFPIIAGKFPLSFTSFHFCPHCDRLGSLPSHFPLTEQFSLLLVGQSHDPEKKLIHEFSGCKWRGEEICLGWAPTCDNLKPVISLNSSCKESLN